LSGEVRRSHVALKIARLTIDKMKVELAYLRRMKYGSSSEKLEHAQLELVDGQVAQPVVMRWQPTRFRALGPGCGK
jgi:transposase